MPVFVRLLDALDCLGFGFIAVAVIAVFVAGVGVPVALWCEFFVHRTKSLFAAASALTAVGVSTCTYIIHSLTSGRVLPVWFAVAMLAAVGAIDSPVSPAASTAAAQERAARIPPLVDGDFPQREILHRDAAAPPLPALAAAASIQRNRPWAPEFARWARDDLMTVPEYRRPVVLYIALHEPTPEARAAVTFVANTCLNFSTTFQPVIYTDAAGKLLGNGNIGKIYLDLFCPDPADFARVSKVRESIFDPNFHSETTVETIVEKRVKSHSSKKGSKPTTKVKREVVSTKVVGFGLATNHRNGDAMTFLASQTHSGVPILESRHFMRFCSTVRNGGGYYKLMGFDGRTDKNQTDLDFVLQKFGSSDSQLKNLKNSERAAMGWSEITNRPRRIDFFFAAATRPSAGYPLITITHDIFDSNTDPKSDALKSLIELKADASELIAPKPDGTLAFALFDGKGKLQDRVPPDITHDLTIKGANADLEPALSCISCHGPHDGRQPAQNDILRQFRHLRNGRRFNPVDDAAASKLKLTLDQQRDILGGLYKGELKEPLRLARNAYEQACYRIARSAGLTCEPGKYAKTLHEITTRIVHEYRFSPVTTAAACYDLGYDLGKNVDEEKAVAVFQALVPELPMNRFGDSPESSTFGNFSSSTKDEPARIQRDRWMLDFQDALLRVITESERQAFLRMQMEIEAARAKAAQN